MDALVAIVGATATGKSALAVDLARRFDGEIVNADSRQVYRYMDIGTAKPTPEERAAVPHHLFDIIDPDQPFSLAEYQRLAYEAVNDCLRRGRLPFLVGGSGQYVWSVIEGWEVPRVPPDPEFRKRMEDLAAREGPDHVHRLLQQIDPEAARLIDARNLRRVIRALEVHEHTGKAFSGLRRKEPPPFKPLLLGLSLPRDVLYRLIDERVDRQIESGLVREVDNLIKSGYHLDLSSMSSLGYKQIGLFLRGELDLPTAIQQVKHETHRFARQQNTWFRQNDPRIVWLNPMEDACERAARLIQDHIGTQ